MDTFINLVIWYVIGYCISLYTIHLCNIRPNRELGTVDLKEALQLSFLSWLLVIICVILLNGVDEKFLKFFDTLNKKFQGEHNDTKKR